MSDEIARREPLDPDTGPRRGLRPVLLVAAGGAIGTTGRYLLSTLIADVGRVPVGVLVTNLSGAFLLGWLIEGLARRGPDTGRRRDLRLLLGTGIIGGFTTYSALAADTAVLLHDGAPVPAVVYGLGTVLLGGAATVAGIVLGRRTPRVRGDRA